MLSKAISASAFIGLHLALAACAGAQTLGEYPMCEASAAVRVSCGGGDCLLVGDNEVRDRLFRFAIDADGLKAKEQVGVSLGDDVEISDIEALADLGGGRLLVLGSHGRNKLCDAKKKRRRFMIASKSDSGLAYEGRVVQGERISCAGLLKSADRQSALVQAACRAIDAAEREAAATFEALDEAGAPATQARCAAAVPFDIEGAVAVPSATGQALWIGLRSPLIAIEEAGAARPLAVLLRMEGEQALSFDAAASIDLGGLSIRELTLAGDWLWGIAGPTGDSSLAFELWRAPAASLQPNATIEPEWIAELPSSSEGLVIVGSNAYVVIDGDQDEKKGVCVAPARFTVVHIGR